MQLLGDQIRAIRPVVVAHASHLIRTLTASVLLLCEHSVIQDEMAVGSACARKLGRCWTSALRTCIPCLRTGSVPEPPVSTLVRWSRWRADLGRDREAGAAARTFGTSATALALNVPTAECRVRTGGGRRRRGRARRRLDHLYACTQHEAITCPNE